jgi:beta-N-acetylhexosaminidase
MTAHVVFDAVDPGLPATLSKAAIDRLLRRDLGYRGVVISDDLEMRAVRDTFGVSESAVRAIDAGCDALLVCSDLEEVVASREALARRASSDRTFRARLDEAAARFLDLRRRCVPRPVVEPVSLADALDAPGTLALEAEIDRVLSETT